MQQNCHKNICYQAYEKIYILNYIVLQNIYQLANMHQNCH